ncbi:hypothetical protein ACTFIV_003203, partial [Dictyostelium citrinum]
EMKK